MEIYLLTCLIFLLSGIAHGLTGFASLLISVPLLSLYLPIKSVVPLVALSVLSITLVLLVQLRHHLALEKIFPLLIGSIPGVPIGVFLLKNLDQDFMQSAVGIILLSYSVYMLLTKKFGQGIRKAWGYLFGFFSGCLCGALGTPGPPVVVYTTLQSWPKDELKGALQVCWFISLVISVTLHAWSGLTTGMVLRYYAVSLPFLLLGTYWGSLFYGKIHEESYKKLILVLLGLLGVFMILKT